MIILKIWIGFLVGALVGLTGLGGGVLLLPVLIFALGVPAIVAVGSDAVFNFGTKIGVGYLHGRQGSVNWPLVVALALGSIPGAIAGVVLLAHIRSVYGNGVNNFLRVSIGLLLVVIPAFLLLQGQLKSSFAVGELPERKFYPGVTAIGLLTGFLFGMTSVGSGSIILMLLLLVYSWSPSVMVGTDIVHAVLLTGASSLLHFRLGTVDPMLVAALLAGSIPGGILGARLSTRIPPYWLRRILCGVLFATGARMLLV